MERSPVNLFSFTNSRFLAYVKEHTAGVSGQQRIPTPPWHLILPLIFVEIRVSSALYFEQRSLSAYFILHINYFELSYIVIALFTISIINISGKHQNRRNYENWKFAAST